MRGIGATVAVLFASYSPVNVLDYGRNLRDFVVEPLRADVIVFLTYLDSDGCNSSAACHLRERLAGLEPVARLAIERQLTTIELAQRLEASPGWDAVWSGFYKAGCSRVGNSTYACRGFKEQGNSFMTPVMGKSSLNVLRQLYMQAQALLLLAQHESTARDGVRYEHVVWARLEFRWFSPHLPLPLLRSSPQSVWVPFGEDYAGLNDRHAFMSRAAADVYLSRWNFIADGTITDMLPCLARGSLCAQSSERFLAVTLTYHNLTVCRMPMVAALQCCSGQCYKRACIRGTLPPPQEHHRALPWVVGTDADGTRFEGKYPQEIAQSLVHAAAAAAPGARYLFLNRTFPPMGFYNGLLRYGGSLVLALPHPAMASLLPFFRPHLRTLKSRHFEYTLLAELTNEQMSEGWAAGTAVRHLHQTSNDTRRERLAAVDAPRIESSQSTRNDRADERAQVLAEVRPTAWSPQWRFGVWDGSR